MDSKRKLFSTFTPQLHNTLLLTNMYGKLGILIGMLLLMLHTMCLSLGQFARTISYPPLRTVGFISVLLK